MWKLKTASKHISDGRQPRILSKRLIQRRVPRQQSLVGDKRKTAQALARSISSNKETKSQKEIKEGTNQDVKKRRRKAAFKECKCMLSESLQSWSDSSGSASTDEGDAISVP